MKVTKGFVIVAFVARAYSIVVKVLALRYNNPIKTLCNYVAFCIKP